MHNNKPFIIIGAGGHALVVAELLKATNQECLGMLDNDTSLQGTVKNGLKILGGDELLSKHTPNHVCLAIGLGSTKDTGKRESIFSSLSSQGYEFPSLVHPTAILASEHSIAEGAQICAGVTLGPSASIGVNTLVNTRATVDHEVSVGDHCHIAPGAILCGGVQVSSFCHIGAGSTIIQNISLGSNTTVSAGALVLTDCPGDQTLFGAPAKRHF